ncbi:CPBP family intramembrane glutamic endopeptidase [Paracoccus sp. SCSIO 75233]|uniref:CPBP family intramembrane glutamic endopeptidase n=1 Tax=Paracoccus sp. SCSIO 75233 TaxID=3017782 RepID=UPI0022F13533|nr:CPBP family intramembrane glutamic endopeptidase [Paracoccus sp. SCSIO 75233]WBU52468.1 CPBP family intramembrane metalloprotease [Paracoccus sp. SCSIO 75233]
MVEQTSRSLGTRFRWARPGQPEHSWLLVEFSVLFVAIPIGIALFLPPRQMFEALFLFSLLGLVLLWITGGFAWRDMVRGWGRFDWRVFLAFAAITFTASVVVLYLTQPEAMFTFLRRNPAFLLLIWLLYPLLSALPQELIFRVLFFHRYGRLFSGPKQAVLVNAAIFSLAHLMYWNWIVAVFTFFGGLAFAVGYLQRGLPWAWALHAIAGNILFAVGMGVYFYSGNAVRPF